MNQDANRTRRPVVSIRELEFDDLAEVYHLGERLFTSQAAPSLYRTWDEHEVINLSQDDQETCLVAEADKRVVGFALGTTVSKPRSAWKYGYLVWLGVEPQLQRQGIATRLFQQFRSAMKRSGVRMLLVDSEGDNQAALEFFRKAGFGNSRLHVYMTLNLAADAKALNTRDDHA